MAFWWRIWWRQEKQGSDTEHDLWLAKNAGCAAVAVSYGAFPKSELKKWKVPVVDNVQQLASALGLDELLDS